MIPFDRLRQFSPRERERERHRPGATELFLHCYYALFECVTRAHNKVGCRVDFTVRLRGRFFASFGTQLGNHPLGVIGARLLGVDKSASSIRLTVIKCFWGCTRQPSSVPTAANIYIGFVKTDGWRAGANRSTPAITDFWSETNFWWVSHSTL